MRTLQQSFGRAYTTERALEQFTVAHISTRSHSGVTWQLLRVREPCVRLDDETVSGLAMADMIPLRRSRVSSRGVVVRALASRAAACHSICFCGCGGP